MNKKSALGKGLGALIPNEIQNNDNNKPSLISLNLGLFLFSYTLSDSP